jgi:hypothetical protein
MEISSSSIDYITINTNLISDEKTRDKVQAINDILRIGLAVAGGDELIKAIAKKKFKNLDFSKIHDSKMQNELKNLHNSLKSGQVKSELSPDLLAKLKNYEKSVDVDKLINNINKYPNLATQITDELAELLVILRQQLNNLSNSTFNNK